MARIRFLVPKPDPDNPWTPRKLRLLLEADPGPEVERSLALIHDTREGFRLAHRRWANAYCLWLRAGQHLENDVLEKARLLLISEYLKPLCEAANANHRKEQTHGHRDHSTATP